jgi:hypothetical protein
MRPASGFSRPPPVQRRSSAITGRASRPFSRSEKRSSSADRHSKLCVTWVEFRKRSDVRSESGLGDGCCLSTPPRTGLKPWRAMHSRHGGSVGTLFMRASSNTKGRLAAFFPDWEGPSAPSGILFHNERVSGGFARFFSQHERASASSRLRVTIAVPWESRELGSSARKPSARCHLGPIAEMAQMLPPGHDVPCKAPNHRQRCVRVAYGWANAGEGQ